jgi:hypothetical protein
VNKKFLNKKKDNSLSMTNYIMLIGLLITFVSCTNKSRENERHADSITIQSKVSSENVYGQEGSFQDKDALLEIINLLMNSSNWYRQQSADWYHVTNLDKETLKMNIVQYADSSGFFTSKMLDSISSNSAKSDMKGFGDSFLGYKLGRFMTSFCSMDTVEMINHIKIEKDSAIYCTWLGSIMNDVPHAEEEGYGWIEEQGPNHEYWQFYILLVKTEIGWKIDAIDRVFTSIKEREDF